MINAEKYIKKLTESFDNVKKCCLDGDIKGAEEFLSEANTYLSQYKGEAEKYRKMKNCKFGVLNGIMESCVAESKVKDAKSNAINECIKIIKNDKNLINEARFYNAMLSYDGSVDAKEFVNEALSLVSGKINPKTMDASSTALAEKMFDSNLTNMKAIDEGYENFVKNCDYVLRTKKNLNNIGKVENTINEIAEYISENKHAINEACSVYSACDDFDKHFKTLNESERELVNDIIGASNGIKEEKQRNLFKFYQEECIKHLDDLIKETDDEHKSKLTSLKEQIATKEYNKDTIVKDITKFLQIGSI